MSALNFVPHFFFMLRCILLLVFPCPQIDVKKNIKKIENNGSQETKYASNEALGENLDCGGDKIHQNTMQCGEYPLGLKLTDTNLRYAGGLKVLITSNRKMDMKGFLINRKLEWNERLRSGMEENLEWAPDFIIGEKGSTTDNTCSPIPVLNDWLSNDDRSSSSHNNGASLKEKKIQFEDGNNDEEVKSRDEIEQEIKIGQLVEIDL
ncbi:hypothetical protein L1987_04474 [Smallanthus sonchifolius]|uniref:Uncharacterized protein n=1 Tax=Smallanthus sonchifolius TaxID=185202 RepID=A0ACB9JSP0_9ASTR|nr:hypothetical protein L1987_04474 [Smallanthus sonchifolius]